MQKDSEIDDFGHWAIDLEPTVRAYNILRYFDFEEAFLKPRKFWMSIQGCGRVTTAEIMETIAKEAKNRQRI